MRQPDKHYTWAKSQLEIAELEKIGWKIADQRQTHHTAHAILMQWFGQGDPRLTEAKAA